jgi:hypothetical protein
MTDFTPWFSVFARKTKERMLGGFQNLTAGPILPRSRTNAN